MSVKGLAFPLRFDESLGHLQRAEGLDKKTGNVERLLLSRRYESILDPLFGITAIEGLFRDIDSLGTLLEDEVRRGVSENEPRVHIESVSSETDDETGCVRCTVEIRDSDSHESGSASALIRSA